MAQEFNYINLHTEYNCSGEFEISVTDEPCFRKIFHRTRESVSDEIVKEKYTVRMFRGLDYVTKTRKNNACLFTLEEVENHLRVAQSEIHPFKFSVLAKDVVRGTGSFPAFEVTMEIEAKFIYHKAILTWFRYLYEHPSNVILREAMKLKQLDEFKHESLLNLYVVTSGCYPYGNYLGDQTLSKGGKFYTVEEFKERLASLESESFVTGVLSKIYGSSHNFFSCHQYRPDNENYHNIEYWDDNSQFEIRLAKYKEAFNLLKK